MVARAIRIGVAGLLAVSAAAGVSGQSTHQHKDSGNYVLKSAYSRVESVRDELQRNPNAYGGHRQKAIANLSTALEELDAALWIDGGIQK